MTDSSSSKVETAKDQASSLKDEALSSGQHVAQTAADQAGSVIGEAKYQAKDLFGQAQSELRDQAGSQQKRVASGLRSVSDELNDMAAKSESGGLASDLVQQVASRAGGIASWLDDRDPGSLLSDVRSYAARKPGTFIAIAAVAGVVAGRLTRSLAGNAKDAASDSGSTSGSPTASGIASSGTLPTTGTPTTGTSTIGTPAFGAPASGFAATGTTGLPTTYSDPVDTDTDIAGPAYSESAYAAPEYQTADDLFEEPTTASVDGSLEGDTYRGDRS